MSSKISMNRFYGRRWPPAIEHFVYYLSPNVVCFVNVNRQRKPFDEFRDYSLCRLQLTDGAGEQSGLSLWDDVSVVSVDSAWMLCILHAQAAHTRTPQGQTHQNCISSIYLCIMFWLWQRLLTISWIFEGLTKGRSLSHINVLIYMLSDDPKNQSEGLYCVRDRAQMSRNIFSAQVGEADGGKDQRNFGWFFCCL